MRPLGSHNYFVYITTNKSKTVLYVGVTNDLENRLEQHRHSAMEIPYSTRFTAKYKAYFLVCYERFGDVNQAIDREKQIKRWSRKKKEGLIESMNSNWSFLNDEIRED